MVNGSLFGWDCPAADPDILAKKEAERKPTMDELISSAQDRGESGNSVNISPKRIR